MTSLLGGADGGRRGVLQVHECQAHRHISDGKAKTKTTCFVLSISPRGGSPDSSALRGFIPGGSLAACTQFARAAPPVPPAEALNAVLRLLHSLGAGEDTAKHLSYT